MMSPQVNYALYAFLVEENKRKIEAANRLARQMNAKTNSRPLFKISGKLLVRLGNWLQEHAQPTDPNSVAPTM